MSDWIGLGVIVALVVLAVVGLKILARPVKRTPEEFERNAASSTSMLGASMNALQELLNPEEAKSRIVQTELRQGRFDKKKREGKGNSDKTAGTAEGEPNI